MPRVIPGPRRRYRHQCHRQHHPRFRGCCCLGRNFGTGHQPLWRRCSIRAGGAGAEPTRRPVISLLDDVLHSNTPAGNQWYNQDGPIAGNEYVISETGFYYARVTLSGCASDSSNLIYFTPTGTQESAGSGVVRVYPNPVSNELNLEAGDDSDRVFFAILNGLGQTVARAVFRENIRSPPAILPRACIG